MDEIMKGIEDLLAAASADSDAALADKLSALADAVAAVAEANPDAPETQPLKDALLDVIGLLVADEAPATPQE